MVKRRRYSVRTPRVRNTSLMTTKTSQNTNRWTNKWINNLMLISKNSKINYSRTQEILLKIIMDRCKLSIRWEMISRGIQNQASSVKVMMNLKALYSMRSKSILVHPRLNWTQINSITKFIMNNSRNRRYYHHIWISEMC